MKRLPFTLASLALLAIIQIPVMAQSTEPGSLPALPSDIPRDHWAYGAIRDLAEKYGIRLGYPDGSFQGQRSLSRYELAALLRQVLNKLAPGQNIKLDVRPEDSARLEILQAEFRQELLELSERVESLEDESAVQAADILELGESLEQFRQNLPFVLFGSLALRSCVMAKNVLSQPDKIFSDNLTGNNFQVRFGGGIRGQAGRDWDYELRLLSTENQSYNLSWFPFGGNQIPRSPISLDRYFVRWRALDGSNGPMLRLSAGKAPNFLPETQLLYDEDVSFSGLQQELSWKNPLPGWKQIALELGEHVLLIEETFITTSLLAAKLSSEWEFSPQWQLRAALSYNHFSGTDRLAPYNFNQGYLGDFSRRNRGAETGDFSSDFGLIDGFARLTWLIDGHWPLSIFGDYAQNLRAADQNIGWLAGVSLGQLRKPGDWEFSYSYRSLQQDYQVSLLVDDNFSGTDVAGHVFHAGVKVAEKTSLAATLINRTSLSRPENGSLTIFYTGLRQDF